MNILKTISKIVNRFLRRKKGLCKTCENWRMAGNKNFGGCNSKKYRLAVFPEEDGVFIQSEGNFYGLIMGKNFGCIHWEKKK